MARVGEVTRAHEDIDLAVSLRDRLAIAGLLSADGWQHAPRHDETAGPATNATASASS
ncbi:MAG TPA: hypothetical protein VKB73_14720 [Gaiellaceae bacterium]|nr:hypothetical protein [Gaiellaceae bacterium]